MGSEIIQIRHISTRSISQKFRKYTNETLSSDLGFSHIEMSYSHDVEILRAMGRNMFYTYDFGMHKNLSHKQSVLFYGHPRS